MPEYSNKSQSQCQRQTGSDKFQISDVGLNSQDQMTMADKNEATLVDLVVFMNTCMYGYPVGVLRTSDTFPIQKQNVIAITHPMAPLAIVVIIMDIGRARPASTNSSLI